MNITRTAAIKTQSVLAANASSFVLIPDLHLLQPRPVRLWVTPVTCDIQQIPSPLT